MNKRFFGVLIFAFLVAATGGFVTYRQLVNHAPAPSAAQPMAKIVIATRNVEAGSIISKDDVQLADWGGPIPAGASAKPEDFVGRGVLSEIYSKEPISESRLAAKGSGGGLASLIPEGLRAFAVRVNDVAGVAGFVTAGMRVDVVIDGAPPVGDPAQGTQARTLLQNIEVLSAGQDFKKDAEGKPVTSQVVNLLVTPDQAEKLSLAANGATIQLVLRNPLDRQIAPTSGTDLAALYGPPGAKPPVPAQAAPKPAPAETRPVVHDVSSQPAAFTMEIISGTQKTEKQFVNQGGTR
jgi:pilus assembly protein CpaB